MLWVKNPRKTTVHNCDYGLGYRGGRPKSKDSGLVSGTWNYKLWVIKSVWKMLILTY